MRSTSVVLRRRRWVLQAVLVAVVVFGIRAFERFYYRRLVMTHTAAVAAAIYVYHHQYGDLPDSLSVIERSRIYSDLSYRLPSHGLDGLWNGYSGPEPHYLPVRDWDGETQYIVAVTARAPRIWPVRGYVYVGSPTAHFAANDEAMAEVLAADNAARKRTGQPANWDEVQWRSR